MNIIDQIVEVLERDDYNITYFYRDNILFGEVKNRPEDDIIIGIRGVGNAPYPFPLTEIKFDLRNGKIEAYREGSLFMESNVNNHQLKQMASLNRITSIHFCFNECSR